MWARCAARGCAPRGAVLGSVLSTKGFKSDGVAVIVTKTRKRALQARHLLVCLLVVNFFMLQAVLVPKIDRSPGGRGISGVSPGLCPSYRQEHRSSRVSIGVGINKQTMGMCLLGTGSCWSFLTQNFSLGTKSISRVPAEGPAAHCGTTQRWSQRRNLAGHNRTQEHARSQRRRACGCLSFPKCLGLFSQSSAVRFRSAPRLPSRSAAPRRMVPHRQRQKTVALCDPAGRSSPWQ